MPQISQVMNVNALSPARQHGGTRRLGFWSAILTTIAAAAALGIAITTAPARSGPNCMSETCITFPYTDAAAFVPNDYIWVIPAFLMGPLFVMLVVCIRHQAVPERQRSVKSRWPLP